MAGPKYPLIVELFNLAEYSDKTAQNKRACDKKASNPYGPMSGFGRSRLDCQQPAIGVSYNTVWVASGLPTSTPSVKLPDKRPTRTFAPVDAEPDVGVRGLGRSGSLPHGTKPLPTMFDNGNHSPLSRRITGPKPIPIAILPPNADLAHPRREILAGAAKCMVNRLGAARAAALDAAFYCRTDEQEGRFATRLSVLQHFRGQSRRRRLGLRHANTTSYFSVATGC
jgi:hypothetical protein